jgi:hypothetical protein
MTSAKKVRTKKKTKEPYELLVPTPRSSKRLPPAAMKWHAELVRAREQRLRLIQLERFYEHHMMALIGPAERGVLPDGTTYSFLWYSRAGYTVGPTRSRRLALETRADAKARKTRPKAA